MNRNIENRLQVRRRAGRIRIVILHHALSVAQVFQVKIVAAFRHVPLPPDLSCPCRHGCRAADTFHCCPSPVRPPSPRYTRRTYGRPPCPPSSSGPTPNPPPPH